MPPTQLRFPGAARDFSPRVNFHCRLSYVCPPCAIACINICALIKDLVAVVRVRWIMDTLKHPACTVGWVARLFCSWLSLGEATGISYGRNPNGAIQLYTKKSAHLGVANLLDLFPLMFSKLFLILTVNILIHMLCFFLTQTTQTK